jgi:heme A synthase
MGDLTGLFSCVLISYALSVVLAWVGLYKLWRAQRPNRPRSNVYMVFNLLGWLLLLALVALYTIVPMLLGLGCSLNYYEFCPPY